MNPAQTDAAMDWAPRRSVGPEPRRAVCDDYRGMAWAPAEARLM